MVSTRKNMLVMRETALRRIIMVNKIIEITDKKTAILANAATKTGVQWIIPASKISASGLINRAVTKNWIAEPERESISTQNFF